MEYKYPDLNLLKYYNPQNNFTDREYVQAMAEELSDTLDSFKVKVRITDIRMTPFAVLFDLMPDRGVSVKTLQNLRIDLEVHMASPVEIVGIGEKQFTVGLAIKNWVRPMIGLRDIMETAEFKENDYTLPIAAGMDVLGKPFVFDLAATPHLLVAGTTGSGKSTFLSDIILSLLFRQSPKDLVMLMIDPKKVELCGFNGIPHMIRPVINDPRSALDSIRWVDNEMMRRYDEMAKIGVKRIEDYNSKVDEYQKLPRIVIIVDEYMEMIFTAPKELEELIQRLARMARASGVHLVLATQRPSSDVITGQIKANIPCRASFTVVDWRESRTILDRTGAERLLGNGDMLYSAAESAVPIHAQAAYVSYAEIDRVVDEIRMNGLR